MLLDPGVVRSALEGQVERQVDAEGFGLFDEALVVVQGAQLGMDGGMPPSSLPMAQGEPGSPGWACTALFLPLRLILPMGWIGGR
jgi:hypothetical protein